MIEEIATNFYRIEIPLPDKLLKSVNSYVIKDRQRNLIIDTGMHDNKCMDAMQAGTKALGIDLGKTDFFITHSHGDHIGLVPHLIDEESSIYLNQMEAQFIQEIQSGTFFVEIENFLRLSGFPQKEPHRVFPTVIEHDFESQNKSQFQFLQEGDIIERGEYQFTCLNTPGHSKGHMCLYEPGKRILVAGDHLLNNITPIIQKRTDNTDPLKEYLSSLDKVCALDIDLVLPGHGRPFVKCRKRIEKIKEHHQQRNIEILSILRKGEGSIYEVASQMTWNNSCDSWTSFPVAHSFFATEEAFSHLGYLENRGIIERKMVGEMAIYRLNTTMI